MPNLDTSYTCQICLTKPVQKSHIESHISTSKHQDKRKILELELKTKEDEYLMEEYGKTDIEEILKDLEMVKDKKLKQKQKPNKTKEKMPSKKTIKLIKKKKNMSYLRLPDYEILNFNREEKKTNNIDKIISKIDKCHNILYQAENIVGQKALQVIMSLLFIKMIGSFLSDKKEKGKIDLFNPIYYGIDDDDDFEEFNKTISYFKDLKNLTIESNKTIRSKDENSDAIIKMGEILKKHPITRNVYTEENFIKVKEATTIRTLIDEGIDLIDMNLFDDNEDVIGEIYEHILSKYVKANSKELGQFFTPRKLMRLILDYKKDRMYNLFKDKNNVNIYDSCMGTGGWLVTSYNLLNNTFNNINLCGGEVEPETFQYGIMNIINTLKVFPEDISCDSSLTHINTNKHTLICTNPPFNSKNKIKFDKIEENLSNDEYTKSNNINIDTIYKLKKDDPPIQFLELDVYKLEDNGMCIIVLPYGEFFFGKNFKETRSHFMNEVNITDIILVPSNTFTHTGIKTCVVIFEKIEEGTKEITFSRISDSNCSYIEKITTVSKSDILNEEVCSWYHTDYLEDKFIHELSLNIPNYEWVEFGEIFTLEKGKIQNSSITEDIDGSGVFINWSQYANFKKIKNPILDGENLFISTSMPNGKNGGYIVLTYYKGKCSFSNLMSKMIFNKNYINKICIKYIYYYLNSIKIYLESFYEKGTCQKSIDIKNLNRMKLPLPSLDIQNKIVSDLDNSNSKIYHMEKIVEVMKNNISTHFEWTIQIENRNPNTKWVEFGEIFTLEKGKLQSSKVEEDTLSDINFITKEKITDIRTIKSNSYYEEGLFIANAFNGNGVCPIRYLNKKCIHSDLMLKINLKNVNYNINIKFIYYYLISLNNHIESLYGKGSCNVSLDTKNLNRMKIQVPPIENQNSCINEINNMEDILERWEKDINNFQEIEKNKFNQLLLVNHK